MARLDIARLRKDLNMNQNELAQKLQINQSFLSAIENGRSNLPVEKEERLRELFPSVDLGAYCIDERTAYAAVDDASEAELIRQFLTRFHKQAHGSDEATHHHHEHHERINRLEEQLSTLIESNHRLLERNDELSKRYEETCAELMRLKELLIRNSISF